jgi:NADH-quinone oxidoreductase subunit F
MSDFLLLRHQQYPEIGTLKGYLSRGGFKTFKKVVTGSEPAGIIDEVKKSGLRGRGGAGFPTGVKWSYLPNDITPHYVVANADESEPGTFKDREIMEKNPFQFLEGLMITCYAVKANLGYVYLRGEFWQIAGYLEECIRELHKQGLLGKNLFGSKYGLDLHTHLGAGAYICGEETALLESLEGRPGQPRLRPPYPAVYGLFGKPTVINNVETLTNVPLIIEQGADWYRTFGTEKSSGVKIFSLSGSVNKPGNYELPLGTTFRELIFNHGGGLKAGRKVKAILPGGASSIVIKASPKVLDTPMDYESVAAIGSALGSASVIVVDDSVSMLWVTRKIVHFFRHESCGKCTPCREGTYWMDQILHHTKTGKLNARDLVLVQNVADQIRNKCLCPLGEFSIMALISSIEQFPEDFRS